MSEHKEKNNFPPLLASAFKSFVAPNFLDDKRTFIQAWDGMSEVYAFRAAERILDKLRGEFKKEPENARFVWSFLLDQWSLSNSSQKGEEAKKAIFNALDSAGRNKQWAYLEMIFDELKEKKPELPSLSAYTKSVLRQDKQEVSVDMDGAGYTEYNVGVEENQGWQSILSVCSLRNAPKSVLTKWFEAREACESPSVLKNKLNVFESDFCHLINTPSLGFKNACSAANAFYGTSSWLWEASQFMMEQDMKEVSAFDNALGYAWLKSWKSLLTEQNYEWTWDCEKKYQRELFQASLLGLYKHKPDPTALDLKAMFDAYVETLALDRSKASNAHLWSPSTPDKSVSLSHLLNLYNKDDVGEFWNNNKHTYADVFKKALNNQSELGLETETRFFNKLRSSFILTNLVQAFPDDTALFVSPVDIEMYKEKGVFYYPGAFDLLKTLCDAGIALDPSVYDVEKKWINVLNVDEEVKSKLQKTLLNHHLQKSIKKVESPEVVKKENFSRF